MTTGSNIMMQIGDYQFGIKTAAYDKFQRSTEYRWEAQKLFGDLDALQFTGPGSDEITLDGTLYPEYNGGTQQLVGMRDRAENGEPLLLVSGTGDILGKWVILSITENGSIFAQSGVARKQEFAMKMKMFSYA